MPMAVFRVSSSAMVGEYAGSMQDPTDLPLDISPMKVINKEERSKSFSGFLVGVCAVIGGTLTVAAAIDRGLYAGSQQMNKMKER